MAAKPLDSAMANLTLQTSPVGQRSSVAGPPVANSSLGMHFVGSALDGQVQIRWRSILLDVVQKLGSTKPVYTCENITDGKCQVLLSFSLPLSSSGIYFRDIAVSGLNCASSWEPENEASIAALKELEHGRLKIRIMDVSALRCRELEQLCHELLVLANNLYHGVKSVISEWQNDMYQTETVYSPNHNNLAADTTGDVCPLLGGHLFSMMKERHLRQLELTSETEAVKIFTDKVSGRVEQLFGESSTYQANKNQGGMPKEIQISMKLVLQEMMITLGWPIPTYDLINSTTDSYMCETSIFPKQGKKLNIMGSDSPAKEIAIDSCRRAAIIILESEKSIWLADLNLNHRLHRELHAVELKKAVESLSLMGSKVLAEWRSMHDEIARCKGYCHQIMMDCSGDQLSLWCKMRRNSNALADLEKIYLTDLQAAEQGLKNIGWNAQ